MKSYYMYVKSYYVDTTNPTLNELFASISPFATFFGVFTFGDDPYEVVEPVRYAYIRFDLVDNIQSIPNISSFLKTTGNNISSFSNNNGMSGGPDDMPNVIFSFVNGAPQVLCSMQDNPSYLENIREWAEKEVIIYNNEYHRHTGTDYHDNGYNYGRMELYNSFHPDSPIHVIGSDDAMSWIHSLNLA